VEYDEICYCLWNSRVARGIIGVECQVVVSAVINGFLSECVISSYGHVVSAVNTVSYP
jgi:hypothetical protein